MSHKKKLTGCPVCNCASFKRSFIKKWASSSFVKCRNCGLLFQNPQESPEKTLSRYGDEYFIYELENQHNFFELVKKTIDDLDVIEALPQNAKILEIGSATGLFLKYMDSLGFDSTGLEICPGSVQYGIKNHGVNIINSTLENAGLKHGTYDLVVFSHLIEHLNDPVSFMKKVRETLKPEGHALLITPNSKGLFAGLYNEDWRCIVDDHLFLFNQANIRMLSEASGFSVIKKKTWGSIPAGKASAPVKKFFDNFVKMTGTGDVMGFLLKKTDH